MKNSIFQNYIFNSLYSLLNIIMPLITVPYISRILEADGVGQVSYAQNIVSYFVLLAALGIPNYGVKEIAKNKYSKKEYSKSFFEIFSVNFVSTTFSIILYFSCIFGLDYFSKNKILYCIVGITLVLNYFNIDWFYKGLEDFKYITLRGSIIKIISVLCVFIFVRSKSDVYIYALIVSVASGINYLINAFHAKKYLVKPSETINVKKHLRAVVVLFSTAVAVELYTMLDTTMVGYMCGDVCVGYYSNAMKLIKVACVAITSLGTVIMPRLSEYYERGDYDATAKLTVKSINYILMIALPCATGMILVSGDFVSVMFGSSFAPATITMRILSLLLPILTVGNIYGTQVLMATNQEKKLMYSVFWGAGINIILNSILIVEFQQNGAAIASVISEVIVMLIQRYYARKNLDMYSKNHVLSKIVAQTVLMSIAVAVVISFELSAIVRLVVAICIGVVVYFGTGVVFKNELQNELLEKVFDLRLKRSSNS